MASTANEPEVEQETLDHLSERNVQPLWKVVDVLARPRNRFEPQIWKGDIVEVSQDFEEGISRKDIDKTPFQTRALIPISPGHEGSLSSTIFLGIQSFPPGDQATSHRHPHFAPRFVLDGHEGLKSIVGGEAFPAHDYDLIITPSWEWHNHINEGNKSGTWLSILDLSFQLEGLGLTEEEHREGDAHNYVDKPDGYYNNLYGSFRSLYEDDERTGSIAPSDHTDRDPRPAPNTVPYRFAWEDCYEFLTRYAEDDRGYDPYNGTCIEYVNPASGQPPVSPTLSLRLQLLSNEETESHSHNAVEAYYVIQGEGETQVDDSLFEWEEGDIFSVPPGTRHAHESFDDETILFGMSDRPILSAFNLYREQR